MARSRQIEVAITRLGGGGDGVAETGAGLLFVPYTMPGDRVQVEIGQRVEGGRRGRLVALLAAGPDRIEPPCPHFHACGGCSLQQAAPAAYGAWKRQRVIDALARRGLDGAVVAPLRTIAPGERRRADLVARRLGARLVLGFHERLSHRIVDLDTCLVLDPRLVALLPGLRALMAEVLAPGAGADIKASVSEGGIDLVIDGMPAPDLARRERLAAFAVERDLARLTLRDAASGFLDPIARRRPALVRFGGIAVEPPPGGFLQASPAAEAILLARVREAVGSARKIADLFAGCGTFALPLSEQAEVLAVESDGAALAALNAAAHGAGRRVTALARDLVRRPLTASELEGVEALVFDPPRAGAREQAAELARSALPVVVGVSCEPKSFARDARLLVDGGYRLESVVPVDQFLWSPHVELVGVFRR